ncbi:OLC1v1025162C1 [Oldenlandia corymbosa var. corymbosa]|uniref:OLC1v1025162C1 n=1 Tax=Oldenlandia corymbosa var. corymbosa TaxID=529605 RepID=A0AAV1C6W9_OLDCO|nr:OLC1v1025162C1 [Oldenlandia corymbosa var. corymbosa]
MKNPKAMINLHQILPLFVLVLSISLLAFPSSAKPDDKAFVRCLLNREPSTSTIIYTRSNSSFLSVLDFLAQNARFLTPETLKPRVILRPHKESQIQAAFYCGRKHDLQMRVRSGGHDFEGASYVSRKPFFLLDMFNFQSLSVDSKSKTAWIGVGRSLGQTYYDIYTINSSLALTGGFWPTVGVGGHISGGGYGAFTRQHGLAADNVLDARIIDVNGRILDRKSMGEDLFWAIRGGVGSDFGVILSYKMRLVEVPPTAVVFHVNRTLEQNAVQLVYKWQQIARSLPVELTLTVQPRCVAQAGTGNVTAQAEFITAYRGGGVDDLLSVFGRFFPELGLTREDCHVVTWIEVYPFLIDVRYDNLRDIMTNRNPLGGRNPFKWKVDFAQDPIPPEGLQKIFDHLFKIPPQASQLGWTIFGGGVMDIIPPSRIPFPHRGKLMIMRQIVFWNANDTKEVVQSRLNWVRNLHDITGAYVPSNPRAQYADYRDFDLGVNKLYGKTSLERARKWGLPYFGGNFDRLVRVKSLVDRENYLESEQSFPVQPAKFRFSENSGVAVE